MKFSGKKGVIFTVSNFDYSTKIVDKPSKLTDF